MFDETEMWIELVHKYLSEDFTTKESREKFRKDFELCSKKMFEQDFATTSANKVATHLSEVWFDEKLTDDELSISEIYKSCIRRIEYCSDRMNYNRWFHIRWLLNKDVE